jgi:hypothetical protein
MSIPSSLSLARAPSCSLAPLKYVSWMFEWDETRLAAATESVVVATHDRMCGASAAAAAAVDNDEDGDDYDDFGAPTTSDH